MDDRLRTMATGLGGVFGSADAKRVGLTRQGVQALVRKGEVRRVRRGAFVLTQAWDAPVQIAATPHRAAYERPPMPEDHYRLRVRAVLRSRGPFDAASHHAALALHEVALYGVDLSVIDVAAPVRRPERESGLHIHPGAGWQVDLVGGARALVLAHALVQLAPASGVVTAVCSMDAAVHGGLCTVADLEAAIDLLPTRQRRAAAHAVALVDPDCESVGETRTRLVLRDLGMTFQSQVAVVDGVGRHSRVDFMIDGVVVLEFDGMVKYEGAEGKRALAAEKARESGLVDLGYEVIRVVWSDLDDPADLARRIRMAKKRAVARRGAAAEGLDTRGAGEGR